MANIAKMNEAAKWIAIKEKFTKGLSTKQARNVSIMMESTRQALNEAVASGATSASNIASIKKLNIPEADVFLSEFLPGYTLTLDEQA